MTRKVLLLLFILTGIIPLSCCPEGPSGPYNLQMQGLRLVNSIYLQRPVGIPGDFQVPTDEAYTRDTLLLSPIFNYELLAQHSFSLQHAAVALSCPDYPYYADLKDKIAEVAVYSNQLFNGVEAGEPLNAKIAVVDKQYGTGMGVQEAVAFINSINGMEFMNSRLGTLAITEKPENALTRTFTVHIKYASGREEAATSAPLLW